MRARPCWKTPNAFELEFFDSLCENLLAGQEPRGYAVVLSPHGIGCVGHVACVDGVWSA
jgi:hypothetical protein